MSQTPTPPTPPDQTAPTAEELYGQGKTRVRAGAFVEALATFDAALALKPDFALAFAQRAQILNTLNRPDEAVESFDRALDLDPTLVSVLINRGVTLWRLKRLDEALASFDRALGLEPTNVEALFNRGITLADLKRTEEAVASYDKTLALAPDRMPAWIHRGLALAALKRPEEACASYERALALKPNSPVALNGRGAALFEMRRLDEALACFDKAIEADPNFAEALLNRVKVQWFEFGRYEPAMQDLEKLVSTTPDSGHAFGYGDFLHLKMQAGDWRDYERQVAVVTAHVRARKPIARPFLFQAVSESPEDLQICATLHGNVDFPPARPLGCKTYPTHKKIRVGYVSGEFFAQATSYLTVGLYERHDREKFEIVAFDNGPRDESLTRRRLDAAFDRFIDISELSDEAAARAVIEAEIDVLINLNGYFGKARMGVFAHRPAAVQVNYLGFPGTLGMSYIDYIVADRIVIPEGERRFYTESVVYLPDSYQVNDDKRQIADAVPSRSACGLPEEGFVFCNFNQAYKLTPATFARWLRLLRQVDGSVLWLWNTHPKFSDNLRREAESQGIAGDRLVFVPYINDLAKHLARLKLADLALDSLPYNCHTTASDALWVGVPLVTCRGKTFPGRVAASLLMALGLPELVTETPEDYEALALKLAREPAQLQALRAKIERNRTTHPLFDTDRFRRHLEAAYTTMVERARRGEPPASFAVAPLG